MLVEKANKPSALTKVEIGKTLLSTSQPLKLLHLDLLNSHDITSLSDSKYYLVIVDGFRAFTWVIFLKHKYESFYMFISFCKRVENEKNLKINPIRSDHGGEVEYFWF